MSLRKPHFALVALMLSGGGVLAQPPAPDIGPPSGPPVPVVPSDGPGGANLPPLGPRDLQPPPVPPHPPPAAPPSTMVPAPSGPFGSGFVYPAPPPGPPPLPDYDWLGGPPPGGWFFGLEGDIGGTRAQDTTGGGSGNHVNLDWTVAPRVTVGYRFDFGGAFLISYRFLQTGTDFDFSGTGGPAGHLGLEENWLDFSYLTRAWGPWCNLRLQGEAGIRLGFLSSHAHMDDGITVEDDTDDYAGAGPHLGLRVSWGLGHSTWALFGKADASVLFGTTRFGTQQLVNDQINPPTFSSSSQSQSQTVWDFRGEVGVSWVHPHRPWMRLDFGVQSETFTWDHVAFTEVGPFLRWLVEF